MYRVRRSRRQLHSVSAARRKRSCSDCCSYISQHQLLAAFSDLRRIRGDSCEGVKGTSFRGDCCKHLRMLAARLTRSGAVSSVGGSCFVAGAGRRRRFSAFGPRARV